MMLLVMNGGRVRRLREERELSRRLAEASGVSVKTIENAELGKICARPATARRVSAALASPSLGYLRAVWAH
jgi:transcriptional regulator with XRE-family HTH domain